MVIAQAVSGQQFTIDQRLSNLNDPLRAEIGSAAFSLRGIESMDLAVEGLGAAAKAIGLTKQQLQTDVELKMRTAGVKVDDSAGPYLYLNVGVVHSGATGRVAFSITLKFRQMGTFLDGYEGHGTTWDKNSFGMSGERGAARYIRESVGDRVDEFLNDYLKANPRH